MLTNLILAALAMAAAHQPSVNTPAQIDKPAQTAAQTAGEPSSPTELLEALALKDKTIDTMRAGIRYTVIKLLESDLQQRTGTLWIQSTESTNTLGDKRRYAVVFNQLVLDQRLMEIREHYIFDGRYFVERRYEERQFNKRELAPEGETLDPMELMSEAPFWVSLGRNTDRVTETYDLAMPETTSYLMDNADYPELAHLAPMLTNHTQLRMEPKPGSSAEDDWEAVRIWFDKGTLLPRLYIKTDWTGDLQIVELFDTETNVDVVDSTFDTTTPPPESGWRVQLSAWRGDRDEQHDSNLELLERANTEQQP